MSWVRIPHGPLKQATGGDSWHSVVPAPIGHLVGQQPVDDPATRSAARPRGSFDSTLNVLEGLLEYERSTGVNGEVAAARQRGEEYLLERRLLHRLSDGEIGQKRWLYAGFPEAWFYTLPRVLDYFRAARPGPDERMGEALDIVESKRDANGRWPLDHAYHDASLVDFDEAEGMPSRWITLRALRVLRWAGREDRSLRVRRSKRPSNHRDPRTG